MKASGQFKVVFWGQAQAGVPRNLLAKRFAKQFNLRSLTQLRQVFSGRLMTVKAGLTESQARKVALQLERLGAQCRVERCRQVMLEGELAERHAPSFLDAPLFADQLSLAPLEEPMAPVSSRRSPFEAREVGRLSR